MDVRALRESQGISQKALAERIGWPQPKLSNVETGKRSLTPGEEALISAALAGNGHAEIREQDLAEPPPEPEMASPRLACYPAAPTVVEGRRAWMRLRNAELQRAALKPPPSGTFGARPKG